MPTGRALYDFWTMPEQGKTTLGKCEREILTRLMIERSLSKEALASITGYSVTSGGFKNALSRLRTLELIEGYDEIQPSRALRAGEVLDLIDRR